MIRFRLIYSVFFVSNLVLNVDLKAQNIRTYKGDFVLADTINGKANFTFFEDAAKDKIFHGKFSFISNLLELNSSGMVEQLMLNGTYHRNIKNGKWEAERNEYLVKIKNIAALNVDAYLNGTQQKLNANFEGGKAHGKWEISIFPVIMSKRLSTSATSSANFVKGQSIGTFSFYENHLDKKTSVEGQFDDDGNFDGTWTLIYPSASDEYKETREYLSGYLTKLTKVNITKDSLIYNLTYREVISKLGQLKSNEVQQSIKRGAQSFGIEFDDGYRPDSQYKIAQADGNVLLKYVFSYYNSDNNILNIINGSDSIMMGKTRRFQYIYPEYESNLIARLKPSISTKIFEIDSILSHPSFRINQQRNDSLAYLNSFLKLARTKYTKAELVIANVEKGMFDYMHRDNYYENGILGFQNVDTVTYEFNNVSKIKIVDISPKISRPDSLLLKLGQYIDALNSILEHQISYANSQLRTFKLEEEVSTINLQILSLIDSVNLLYTGTLEYNQALDDSQIKSKNKLSDLQLVMYKRFAINRKNQLMQQYSNATNLSDRIQLGNNIVSLLTTMIELFPQWKKFDELPSRLEKSFIRYTDNPFFDRALETKIKQHIYSKGVEVLLPYFIGEIKVASTAADIRKGVEIIWELEEKLVQLAKSDDTEVNKLNSRLRRENQPERIRRLLGI